MLGRRASGEFGDHSRHRDARPIPGLVILRLDAPLYFFNANVARSQILGQAAAPDVRAILLDLGASADLDIGTSDMLRDLIDSLRRNQIDVLLAQVRGSVRNRMRLTGLSDSIHEDHVFSSVAAAVRWYEASPPVSLAPDPAAPDDPAGPDQLAAERVSAAADAQQAPGSDRPT